MFTRFPTLLALLLIAALALAACVGDDDDGSDGADGADGVVATAPATAADEPDATATDELKDDPTAPAGESAGETEVAGEEPSGSIVDPPARDESIPVNGRVLGDPDAPVSVVEYGDFQ